MREPCRLRASVTVTNSLGGQEGGREGEREGGSSVGVVDRKFDTTLHTILQGASSIARLSATLSDS